MKNFITLFLLFTAASITSAKADTKISQLPIGSAAACTAPDSFVYVDSSDNATKRLVEGDLAHIPALAAAFAPSGAPITLTAVGSTPAAAGASLSGSALTLQPADGTHPGLVSTTGQTFAGNKNFSGNIFASNLSGTNSGDLVLGTANGLSLPSGQTLSLGLSSTSTTGALSSTDWNTFNGKASPGSYITALTGDGTATGPGSSALTLATVNSNTGAFGSSTAIPTLTVNGKGLITAATTNAVIAPAGTVTGTTLASNVVSSSLTSVGAITSGTWSGGAVASTGNVTGTNLSGTNTGDVTLVAVGSTPSANGASIASQVLTLQPSDSTHPGLVTTGAQTWAGAKTFSSAPVISQITNTGTLTLPTATDTLVGRQTTDTLTNKTISGGSNTLSSIANASLTNSSVTVGSTAISLGGTAATVSGLTLSAAAHTGTTTFPSSTSIDSGGVISSADIRAGSPAVLAGTFRAYNATDGSRLDMSSTTTRALIQQTFGVSGGFLPLVLQTGGNPALTLDTSQGATFAAALKAPALSTSSASTTGTLCWTTGTGNINVDTTTTCLLSTQKVKKDIEDLDSGLNVVNQMRPVSYQLKDEYNPAHLGRQVGFIAEEMVKVDDRLVSLDENGDPHAVRYQQTVAVLAKAIQELSAKVTTLEAQLKEKK